jgi:hypothetical protein
MPPKKARSEKNQPKIKLFTSEKENPWSEDETDTGTTTEANEPIEVDDDVSHECLFGRHFVVIRQFSL